MQAIVCDSPGSASLSRIQTPDLAPDAVRVEIAACGICHTDIDVLHGRYGKSDFPLVSGHEYSGTVEAVGEGVSTVSVGDRVVVDPNLSCGRCRPCRRGLRNLCERLGAYGVSANGGFAEYSTVAAANVLPIGAPNRPGPPGIIPSGPPGHRTQAGAALSSAFFACFASLEPDLSPSARSDVSASPASSPASI